MPQSQSFVFDNEYNNNFILNLVSKQYETICVNNINSIESIMKTWSDMFHNYAMQGCNVNIKFKNNDINKVQCIAAIIPESLLTDCQHACNNSTLQELLTTAKITHDICILAPQKKYSFTLCSQFDSIYTNVTSNLSDINCNPSILKYFLIVAIQNINPDLKHPQCNVEVLCDISHIVNLFDPK